MNVAVSTAAIASAGTGSALTADLVLSGTLSDCAVHAASASRTNGRKGRCMVIKRRGTRGSGNGSVARAVGAPSRQCRKGNGQMLSWLAPNTPHPQEQ